MVENDKIAENDYNISVSSYVEQPDTREVIDIDELNEAWDAWVDPGFQPPRSVIVGTTIAECYKLYMTVVAAKTDR